MALNKRCSTGRRPQVACLQRVLPSLPGAARAAAGERGFVPGFRAHHHIAEHLVVELALRRPETPNQVTPARRETPQTPAGVCRLGGSGGGGPCLSGRTFA